MILPALGIETYTANDEPVIRRALTRRLDAETGVRVLEVKVKDHRAHITVGVLLHVDDKVIVRSVFDLPPQFKLAHIVNEADEIAEGCKEARRNHALSIIMPFGQSEERQARGTGRRGNWRKHYGI